MLTKDLVLQDIRHQNPQLQVEHPRNQIRSVMSLFARQEVLSDLAPVLVAGEGDEEVRTAEFGGKGHGVLIQLLHIPWATVVRGREDDMLLAGLSTGSSTIGLSRLNASVGISANGLLGSSSAS